MKKAKWFRAVLAEWALRVSPFAFLPVLQRYEAWRMPSDFRRALVD